MLASLLAAGMPLGAQNLGSEYRLKRVIPVEGRQGVAADSNFYYVSGSTALYKYDKQGRLAAKNERPFEGLPLAANHIGDIDVWDGEIYAGIETFDDGRGENIQVAVYDANTLKWKRSIDWEPSSGQVEVCGLAVDRDGDMVWMADWVDGRYLYVADLRDGKSYATVLPFRLMADFRRPGEIEGLAVDPATDDLLVLANRGARIVLGMPRGFYPGYDGEVHEVYVFEKVK